MRKVEASVFDTTKRLIARLFPSHGKADSNLADLQRRLVERLAIVTAAAAGACAVLLLSRIPEGLPVLSFALLTVTLAASVWLVNERGTLRSSTVARHLFVWGSKYTTPTRAKSRRR